MQRAPMHQEISPLRLLYRVTLVIRERLVASSAALRMIPISNVDHRTIPAEFTLTLLLTDAEKLPRTVGDLR